MKDYLDVMFENKKKYKGWFEALNNLIIGEIFCRHKIIIDKKKISFDRNAMTNAYVLTLHVKQHTIKVILDDFNLTITKLHDTKTDDDDVKLNLQYRKMMCATLERDFKYKNDLKEHICKNMNYTASMILPYLSREINKTLGNIDGYNLDLDMPNKTYLKVLERERSFYLRTLEKGCQHDNADENPQKSM